MEATREARVGRALASLVGLSVGDALGETYFGDPHDAMRRLLARELRSAPWRWTDDTEMALVVTEHLAARDAVDADALALAFAERMTPGRGYGAGAYQLLQTIRDGAAWGVASRRSFRGEGSFGNGAAMRVAPLGAYFADDLPRAIAEAERQAVVTHAHVEGIAGAVAVACAAAFLADPDGPRGESLLRAVRDRTPGRFLRETLDEALTLPHDLDIVRLAGQLGNGSGVTAPDTVPLCLHVAAYAPSYEAGVFRVIAALGDRDTTAAIVGGLLAARDGHGCVPAHWESAREPLPEWFTAWRVIAA